VEAESGLKVIILFILFVNFNILSKFTLFL
jgi:hypothetical protein